MSGNITIQDKIKYIEGAGLGFFASLCGDDYSSGAVASNLFKKGYINQQKADKINLISENTNFFSNKYLGKPLNSNSILFVNLVYNILISKTVKNEKI